MLTSSKVLEQSGVKFGTSGARGLVTQFTPDVCSAFTVAFVSSMQRNFTFETVAIAIDNRPSSEQMAKACASALKQLNINFVYYGVVPTPALAYIAQKDGIPAIMVTGSHIPFDRNGLKFYRPDGEISKADEQVIIHEKIDFLSTEVLAPLAISNKATEEYIKRYTSLFNTPWLKGKRIGIYEHSSAGRDLYYQIFEKLGAEVVSIGRSDEFVPIDTEAVSEEDKAKAILWSKEHKMDVVFSTDGDGDRPLVSDENGVWLRGDILGLLTANALNIEALAVPVSCNTAIELSKNFKHVARTKIGSPYVIAEFATLFEKFDTVAGFEANGGFLLGSNVLVNNNVLTALPTRDAVLPVLMLLLAAKTTTISALINDLPARYTYSDRIQNFAIEKSQAIILEGKREPERLLTRLGLEKMVIEKVDSTDGLRITLHNGNIIHLRPSGNAPELRCYVEAENDYAARELCLNILKRVKCFN